MTPALPLINNGAAGKDAHDVLEGMSERLGSLEAVNTYLFEIGERRARLHDVATGRRARRPTLGGASHEPVVKK